jgi:hypothetical protein
MWLVFGVLTCAVLPIALLLGVLRTFANRACVLEGCNVFEAYARGFNVLVANLGSAILLFLVQLGVSILLSLFLLAPSLCCVLWPLLILLQGWSSAYFSTMWTLAWRRWVGDSDVQTVETVPA